MLKLAVLSFLPQGILILTGLAILQLLQPKKKISFLFFLPYAWGMGMMGLFLFGSFLVRLSWLKGIWHWVILGIFFSIMMTALLLRKNARETGSLWKQQSSLKAYEWLFLFLIIIKLAASLYGVLINPVIDSDAASPFRWMGLAKVIGENGMLPQGTQYYDRLMPSLLAVWTRMFLPRWYDSFAGIPWFVTYFSWIGVAFVAASRLLKNRLLSFVLAYFFASIPLALVHVMRPGYADLVVAYFFLASVSWIAFLFFDKAARSYYFLALAFAVGCFLTKTEGLMMLPWVSVIVASYSLNAHYLISWKKILIAEAIGAGILYLIYFATADWILHHFKLEFRIGFIFTKSYDPRAMSMFYTSLFEWSSFNLWWWFVVLASAFIFLKRATVSCKVLTLYCMGLLCVLFYYCCFTGNIPHTLNGTNIGRFGLQISGLFLPIYIGLIKLAENYGLSTPPPAINPQKK